MILAHLKTCHPPLSSFALKAPELPPSSSYSVIVKLLEAHAQTLKKLSFFDCSIGLDSVTAIAESCTHLEQLALPLPIKELVRTPVPNYIDRPLTSYNLTGRVYKSSVAIRVATIPR
jgi:hypothetical protein